MTNPFPNIKPTKRSFTMGDVPSATYKTLSGAVFRRAFGNTITNYTLTLTFVNIADSEELLSDSGTTEQILSHYELAQGTFQTFALQDNTFVGMDNSVQGYIKAPSNIKWRYAKAPQIESVRINLSTVSVNLVGEIEA